MGSKISVLVIGCGNMGASHATSYHNHKGFHICGLVSRGKSKEDLNRSLDSNYPLFSDFKEAILITKPDAVCISTYPDTHEEISLFAIDNNCHIFLEKPIAADLIGSRKIIEKAEEKNKKLVVGYILRHHPIWKEFIKESKKLGKPLVMRMNLNQQSSGDTWKVHKSLLASLSPIVDCGVHYLDVMCQMTESRPLSVSAIGVRLSDEVPNDNYNYGQLQIRFEDGSVGWYEAGWGPMISETAFFVKDVIGPKGSVSIVSEDDVFEKKDEIANSVKGELNDAMTNYGYDIIRALVTDIDPDTEVKAAMNKINAAERKKVAHVEKTVPGVLPDKSGVMFKVHVHDEQAMKDFVSGRNPVMKPIYDECIQSIDLYELTPVSLD